MDRLRLGGIGDDVGLLRYTVDVELMEDVPISKACMINEGVEVEFPASFQYSYEGGRVVCKTEIEAVELIVVAVGHSIDLHPGGEYHIIRATDSAESVDLPTEGVSVSVRLNL